MSGLVARHGWQSRWALPTVASGFRHILAGVYLLGAPTHVYFALWNAAGYRGMSDWSPPWNGVGEWFWFDVFLPYATVFGLLVAVAELAIGIALLSRSGARGGLVAAALFHMTLFAIFGMWPYTIPMIVAIVWTVLREPSS
jgi:hypothetical protein